MFNKKRFTSLLGAGKASMVNERENVLELALRGGRIDRGKLGQGLPCASRAAEGCTSRVACLLTLLQRYLSLSQGNTAR